MTTKPSETQSEEMVQLKVRPSRRMMLSIIAKVDGKLLQDVTDEAVSEYIERRGITINAETATT